VLLFSDVQTMGPDVIVARSESGMLTKKQWQRRGMRAGRTSSLRNKRVVTRNGRAVGTVKDVYVDERTGSLAGYEVARRGLMRRRSLLRQSEDITIGRDVMLIPDHEPDPHDAREESPGRIS
jgi:uncharacterized protein YrrD